MKSRNNPPVDPDSASPALICGLCLVGLVAVWVAGALGLLN